MPKLSPLEIARLLSFSDCSSLPLRDYSSHATIFEIPLILDVICQDLTRVDISHCQRVCRSWRSLFERHLWREIKWSDSVKAEIEERVVRNAHWLRTLTVPMMDTTLVDSNATINLRKLCIQWRRPWDDEDDDYMEYEGENAEEESFPSAFGLIKQNPGLETLEVDCTADMLSVFFGEYRRPNFTEPRHEREGSPLLALRRHPSLQSIQFRLWPSFTSAKGLAFILRHCPASSLRELTFHGHTEFNEVHSPSLSTCKEVWPTFSALRSLSFSPDMRDAEDLLIIRLVENSPNLVKLTNIAPFRVPRVVSAIIKNCPKLEVIHLCERHFQESEILRLIQPYSRLRELRFYAQTDFGDLIIPALLEQCAATLEVLQVFNAVYFSSKSIIRILAECPRLKKLEIYLWDQESGVTLRDLIETPWASSRIETLRVPIIPGHRGQVQDEGEPMDTLERRQKVAEMILRLYRKLMSWESIKWAYFSWRSPEFIMPEEVGLKLMGGEVTPYRLRWMGLSWPTLKEIQDREQEKKLREMGIYVCDPSSRLEHNTESDEVSDNEDRDEVEESEPEYSDDEYAIYKSRNRHQQRSSRRCR